VDWKFYLEVRVRLESSRLGTKVSQQSHSRGGALEIKPKYNVKFIPLKSFNNTFLLCFIINCECNINVLFTVTVAGKRQEGQRSHPFFSSAPESGC